MAGCRKTCSVLEVGYLFMCLWRPCLTEGLSVHPEAFVPCLHSFR